MVNKLQTSSKANAAWLRALQRTAHIGTRPAETLPVLVDQAAKKSPDAPALLSAKESLSYGELSARANRYAHWAQAHDIGEGNVVALLMSNRPEYVAIWLGLSRVGAAVALLNTHLPGVGLAHCVRAAGATTVIVEAQFAAAARDLPADIWLHGEAGIDRPRIDHWVGKLTAPEPLALVARLGARALLIYTSGTTGLPKAASISHHRILQWSQWFAGIADLRPTDRCYNCLPLYHSVGGVAAVGAALVAGGSVFVRDKFSARQFWYEVVRYDCTVFQYIGELCRYLLSVPVGPEEGQHKLRLACGNGLRADVWRSFQERYRIPQILEFYASTEGNFSLFNAEGYPGAIGRFPNFLPQRKDVALIQIDRDSSQARRSPDGRCVRCGPDDAGEAISRIGDSATARFEGYADVQATQEKILRHVFSAGDAWFRSGDLMRKDARGFFYFVDRIGDTFRWKGENVATAEVSTAIRGCPGAHDADAYGVAIPGTDGKAGMAAVVAGAGFDLAQLHAYLKARLPAYARPLFIRLCRELSRTATFKVNTQALRLEGFDPAVVADPLFFDRPGATTFVPFDRPLYADLIAGRIRL